MDDPQSVRGFDRIDDLTPDRDGLVHIERPARQTIGQRRTLDQFENEATHTIHGLDSVDGRDVRVVEGRQQPGLALDAGQSLGVGCKFRRQHFQGDASAQPRVAGLIDVAHPSGAQQPADLEDAEPSSG